LLSLLKLKLSPTPGLSIDCCVPLHVCVPRSVAPFCRSLPPACESLTSGYLVVVFADGHRGTVRLLLVAVHPGGPVP
jgi:hypothetical protein